MNVIMRSAAGGEELRFFQEDIEPDLVDEIGEELGYSHLPPSEWLVCRTRKGLVLLINCFTFLNDGRTLDGTVAAIKWPACVQAFVRYKALERAQSVERPEGFVPVEILEVES